MSKTSSAEHDEQQSNKHTTEEAGHSGGRDANGRFTKNNPGGPGNPYARYTAAMRKAFAEEASADDLRKVARAMIEKAQQGDVAAAKLVCSYTMGKPLVGTDPDHVDADEWQTWKANAVPDGETSAVLNRIATTLACHLLRETVPALSLARAERLAAALAAAPAVKKAEEAVNASTAPAAAPAPAVVSSADDQAGAAKPEPAARTEEEILAGLTEAQRQAREEVFGKVGWPGAAQKSDGTDDKRLAAAERAANSGGRVNGEATG
jgi:hypothetical protein